MSTRSEAKKRRYEACVDQVALDKLQGLESGYACRLHYKKLRARALGTADLVPKRKGKPRAAETYRAAKRIAERGQRRSLQLKAERMASGETRSQADARRRLEALAA